MNIVLSEVYCTQFTIAGSMVCEHVLIISIFIIVVLQSEIEQKTYSLLRVKLCSYIVNYKCIRMFCFVFSFFLFCYCFDESVFVASTFSPGSKVLMGNCCKTVLSWYLCFSCTLHRKAYLFNYFRYITRLHTCSWRVIVLIKTFLFFIFYFQRGNR